MSSPRRTIHVHVGAPKTGTTYLQDRLAANVGALEAHGVHYPLGLSSSHFGAALDLIDKSWGQQRESKRGDWAALVRGVLATPPGSTVLVSHEVFAGASARQARRAITALSAEGDEVHVVYAARDLARQIPAEWQEGVKHRRRNSFEKFAKRIREAERGPEASLWFWRAQDVRGVLTRWGAELPPERVHLVTVPPPGAPRGELYERYCRAFGIQPDWAPRETGGENTSVGTAEVAMLRKLNRRLKQAGYPHEDYRRLVRQLIVHETLAARSGSTRAVITPEVYAWARPLAEEWIGWVGERGFDVVGDLADLRFEQPEQPRRANDDPRTAEVLDAALDALVAVLQHAGEPPARRGVREWGRRAVRAVRRARAR